MNEQIKKLVPRLRFPEFQDAGDWTEIELINTADKKIKWSFIGGPFGSNLKSSDYVKNGVRVIQLQNIGDANFTDDYQIFTSVKKANELLSNNIYPGEIILSKMGDPVGRACLIPETHDRYVMCSDGIRLVVDERSHSKYFIYSLINSSQFRALVEKTATGSTRKRIGLDDLKSLPMVVPKKEEQQKIADCLSSIDELITAQTNKIAALKDHKKGLMQQLFPVEGETVPKLRFTEFQDAGEWEQETLENLIDTVTPPQKLPTSLYQKEGDYPIIDQSQSYICGRTNNQDALIVGGLPVIIFGDHTCALKMVNVPFAQGADGIKILKTKEQVETGYLYQYLQFNPVVMEEYKRHFSILKEKLIIYPKIETGEQQKIANCLSSIDELITAQTQKLAALKDHKKGLMQQLFSSVGEVSE